MSITHLAEMADEDTPKAIQVPQTLAGVIVWAAGRWGIGVIFAVATYYIYQDFRTESNRVYADNKASNTALLEAYKDQAVINSKVASAVDRLTEAVAKLQEIKRP